MPKSMSRRTWLKSITAAGVSAAITGRDARGAAVPRPATSRYAAPGPPQPDNGAILPLTSTSGVDIPTRGRGFMKFSFDFPEPSVAFEGLRVGFMIFTRENAYGLDRDAMRVEQDGDELVLRCDRLIWAGGQRTADGTLEVRFRRDGDFVEWDTTARMGQPIKSVKAIVRGVPRGRISVAGNDFTDPGDGEVLYGYPFGGGDLFGGGNRAGGMTTPLAVVEAGEDRFFFLSSLDDRVRTKRFYFQPGEAGYRAEAIHEVEGWLDRSEVVVPTWRAGWASSFEAAVDPHFEHLERAYRLLRWETRADVPDWLRGISLAVTLHGMHYTGYVFNDFARMLEILSWIGGRIPPEQVLVYITSWDGRYYWDYPDYVAAERLGGEAGMRRLIREGQRQGFRMMPMFGANAANRRRPAYAALAGASTSLIDGNEFALDWVDWDNDRHQEGWLAYMNLGVASWREHLTGRIADCIERYRPDAYFLDIIGGWVNNPTGDMHEGARRMVFEVRERYPDVVCCGEMIYDALLEFIPLFHVRAPRFTPYMRYFRHLSHPAPGRGSSGVHEWGFGRWDPETLSLERTPGLIATLSVVDDTFDRHRDEMAAVIELAKTWRDDPH